MTTCRTKNKVCYINNISLYNACMSYVLVFAPSKQEEPSPEEWNIKYHTACLNHMCSIYYLNMEPEGLKTATVSYTNCHNFITERF